MLIIVSQFLILSTTQGCSSYAIMEEWSNQKIFTIKKLETEIKLISRVSKELLFHLIVGN